MGRPSKLSREQWLQIEQRHVVNGEPILKLAKEYGIDESSLRRKLKPNLAEQARGITSLRGLAAKKIKADAEMALVDAELSQLPEHRQLIVHDLVKQLGTISTNLAAAADFGSSTAAHLAGLANRRALKISDKDKDPATLQHIAALQRLANEAGAPAIAILSANRDMLPKPGAPGGGIAEMTDEEFNEECARYGIDPA